MSEDELDVLSISDGSQSCADDDVDGMILATAKEHPEAARKFLVTTPAIVEKMKAKAVKRKRATTEGDDKKVKKAKAKAKKTDTDDDDSDPPPCITYYINIPKAVSATTTKKRASSSKSDNDVLQKGPFSLRVSDSYPKLLATIATELPCRVEQIHQSKITWKPKKPQNAEKLPLGKEKGYKALVAEMEGKADGARVVLLFMPPPAKPMEDENPWVADEEAGPAFDFGELESSSTGDSIQEQKNSFNKATKDERAVLETKYPVGNNANFPSLRVYQDPKTNFYFELNSIRLGLWASAIAQKKTDENTPPSSRYFDADARIKVIPTLAAPAAPAAPAAGALPALPALPPAAQPPSLSITDLVMASLLTQSGGTGGIASLLFPQLNGLLPPVVPPPAAAPPPALPLQPRTAPPSPVKRHTVTRDQFCELYNIDESDAVLLKEVGFRPGDKTSPEYDEEIKKAGFSLFSWRRIHEANVSFKADLAKGNFD
ncbi:hypothetical protein C8R47DRAFT_1066646 [Mycena vitilis]|nr:hypothetical protein C8R47DRAFT_1066646 [Mycena vitilis]